MEKFIWYLIFINVITIIIYGIDKILAIKKKRKITRISERWLFLLSLFGGCVGSIIGMKLFRHKTSKWKFWLWNIIMVVVWTYLVYSFIK